MTTPTVVLAVSGHGFGHAVRCAELARALDGAQCVARRLLEFTIDHTVGRGLPFDQ
jgi:hypothetical protein